jgi:proline iminopeptidase
VQRLLPVLAQDPRRMEAAHAFAQPGPLGTDEDLAALLERILPLYFVDPEGAGVAAAREYVRSHRISRAAQRAVEASDGRFPVRDRLGTVRVPTLVMAGRHDFICSPAQAQIVHAGIRESRLAIFEKSGHFPWIEEPDLFVSTVVSFLQSGSQSARSHRGSAGFR